MINSAYKVSCWHRRIHLHGESKTAYNSTYKKLVNQWLNEALCLVSSMVVADRFVLRNDYPCYPEFATQDFHFYSLPTFTILFLLTITFAKQT